MTRRRPRPAPIGDRRRSALALLTAAALVVAACSDPPTSGGDEAQTGGNGNGGADLPDCPLDALDEAGGPVEVTLWYGGLNGSAKIAMDDMAAAFNASQDAVVLNASNQGASYEEVYRKYTSAAAAGTDQLPDMIYLEDTQLQAMADSGQVLPAEACMEAADYDLTNLEPAARAKYSVDDVLYPGYVNVSTPVLYYNKSHWEKAGLDPEDPPETLDELHEQAQAIKEAGVSAKPFSFKATRWFYETWLTGVGGEIVNENDGRDGLATEATFASDEGEDVMERLVTMNDEGLLNVFANTEGGIDHYLALITQESSMLLETSTASTTIRDALGGAITAEQAGADFDASAIDLSVLVPGAGQFPGIEAPGRVFPSGGAFYMLNTSEPAEQAGSWAFMEFMLQPENAKMWHLNGGYLPVVKAVADEPDVQAFWEDDLAGVLLQPAVEQLADADPDQPGPLIGPYPDETRALQSAMEAILLEGADITSTLEGAEDDVTESLERYAG
ncbi:MAG: ABC transporter substrate-binding protein [Acidimicrobiales bacterium]|nr:ABC transporter substrate-binding protein [Acidimicrobiales bacterium]